MNMKYEHFFYIFCEVADFIDIFNIYEQITLCTC